MKKKLDTFFNIIGDALNSMYSNLANLIMRRTPFCYIVRETQTFTLDNTTWEVIPWAAGDGGALLYKSYTFAPVVMKTDEEAEFTINAFGAAEIYFECNVTCSTSPPANIYYACVITKNGTQIARRNVQLDNSAQGAYRNILATNQYAQCVPGDVFQVRFTSPNGTPFTLSNMEVFIKVWPESLGSPLDQL